MATDMILPALGMSQDTGKVVRWLKSAGELVQAGDAIVEIETDKTTVELEAPATGILVQCVSATDEDIPVGHIIAQILAPDESIQTRVDATPVRQITPGRGINNRADTFAHSISPLAARIAVEHQLDLRHIQPRGSRIEKTDVLAYMQQTKAKVPSSPQREQARLLAASPKARRLAEERGINLSTVQGSGPGNAILTVDIVAHDTIMQPSTTISQATEVSNVKHGQLEGASTITDVTPGTVWRIMAERTTQSWTTVPHFFLMREINASRFIAWREQLHKRLQEKCTYTDLLVKVVAAALKDHPRINASWQEKHIHFNNDINIGIAVAIEDGLVVPVIQQADQLQIEEIAQQRKNLVARAQSGKLRPQEMQNGTFTISNLGMYGVDGFSAIINPPQAAILAVSRISERVVAINGQPTVQPMLTCNLSCDHRVIDGARGAQFLSTIADLIEEPLGLLH